MTMERLRYVLTLFERDVAGARRMPALTRRHLKPPGASRDQQSIGRADREVRFHRYGDLGGFRRAARNRSSR